MTTLPLSLSLKRCACHTSSLVNEAKLGAMREAVAACYYPGYTFRVTMDGRGAIYLQAEYMEPDVSTMVPELQLTRRWFLSPHMSRSEIVQTAFKCVMTSMEHRVREWFRYRGNAIFGPHFNVDSLWDLCTRTNMDTRT